MCCTDGQPIKRTGQDTRVEQGTEHDCACAWHPIGTVVGCVKGLNKLRKAYLVLVNVMREVRVLEEHISDTAVALAMLIWRNEEEWHLQPLLGATDLPGTDTREAVTLEIVRVDWGEQNVGGVDVKGLTAERQGNRCSVGARDDEATLTVALRSGDLGVNSLDVGGGSDDESGAGVEDGSAALESDVLTANGHSGEVALPETVRVDVRDGNEGLGVELGLVKTSERNLAVVATVGNSGDLVRRDGCADQPILCERLDGGQDTLVGKARLG